MVDGFSNDQNPADSVVGDRPPNLEAALRAAGGAQLPRAPQRHSRRSGEWPLSGNLITLLNDRDGRSPEVGATSLTFLGFK